MGVNFVVGGCGSLNGNINSVGSEPGPITPPPHMLLNTYS